MIRRVLILVSLILTCCSLSAFGESVPKSEDWLNVSGGWAELELGEKVSGEIYDFMSVDSGSAATISVSGLPTGLAYDTKKKRISGKTTKRGVFYVKFSAKNANGYSMSDTCIWNVGEAGNGDYDKIGLADMCDLYALEDLYVGERFEACGFAVSSVTGLPAGLSWTKGSLCTDGGLCTACSGVIRGTPTKAGKYVIEFVKGKLKTRKTVIVRDAECGYLKVGVGEDYIGRGTVSGGGVKRPGATVKLSAKPAKNRYFAGWYTDSSCSSEFTAGKSGDYRTLEESFVFTGTTELYARFVTKGDDSQIWINVADQWNVETDEDGDSIGYSVESITKPTVSVKGLPDGIKKSGARLYVYDKSLLKPGVRTVTLTAKNLSGATVSRKISVVVPNIRSELFQELEYDDAYEYKVGESLVCRDTFICEYESGWTVKPSGVPDGLKLSVGNGYCRMQGVATKAGTYTVTLTATKGKEKKKATFTVIVTAFPSAFVGSYGGDVVYGSSCSDDDEEDEYDDDWEDEEDGDYWGIGSIYDVVGTFSMSIASSGKISVKFNAAGKSVSLSGYSCDVGSSSMPVYLSSGSNGCELNVLPVGDGFDYQVSGNVWTASGTWNVRAQRNEAKTNAQMKKMVAKLAKLGAIQGYASSGYISCPNCVLTRSGKPPTPNVYFTVDTSGKVKSSGKIAGRKVSGSAQLQVVECEDDYILYADFCDLSKSTPLVYRVVFSWDWLTDPDAKITAKSALSDGAYRTVGAEMCYKPVIYLYPEAETACSVKLLLNGRLTCTYPDYGVNGWRDFVAAPDGTLTFPDGQQYYCLYWEGGISTSWDFSRGYCVKGSETGTFLADVLLEMGLSFREANEFIIYWLPLMQDNPYNVISFQGERYTKAAKLKIEPQPDSVLRVFMAWKPSAKPVDIVAPTIEPFERKGFTVVEWGGTKVAE